MRIIAKNLLRELSKITNQSNEAAQRFLQLPDEKLNHKNTAESWSILECLEHLNLYGDYYLPEMKNQMDTSKSKAATDFKSGWLGNYFANSMKEKNGKITKMKSPKDKVPATSHLSKETIHRFLSQTEELVSLIKEAETKDLNKIRIPISLSKYIKIKLGDTLRFYLYHIERHIAQAERNI
ncbi:MAG: DinB family protein [Chitinophagaceae bacterium]|jgi:hypothetical protein